MQDVFVFDAPLERFSAWWGCFVHGFEGEKVAQKENVVEGHSVDGCGRKEIVDCCAKFNDGAGVCCKKFGNVFSLVEG